MTKELLNQFEELELFSENMENALEAARVRTTNPLYLELYVGSVNRRIRYTTEQSIENFNNMLTEARTMLMKSENKWCPDETFIDIWEKAPDEDYYSGVTVWLNYVDGKVLSRVQC